jgi:predicted metal-dependent hydrolase
MGPDLRFVRHPRARRYRLRVGPDGEVRVTIPRGGSRRVAERFARDEADWIAREQARQLARPRFDTHTRARLRREAALVLPTRVAALAARHGLRPTHVGVGDQRTRWGSCSRTGAIRLNWRLVLMPAWVRDYVLVHELMHLRHLDHGPAFWRLVADACPEWRDARAWLRQVSPARLEAAAAGDDAGARSV